MFSYFVFFIVKICGGSKACRLKWERKREQKNQASFDISSCSCVCISISSKKILIDPVLSYLNRSDFIAFHAMTVIDRGRQRHRCQRSQSQRRHLCCPRVCLAFRFGRIWLEVDLFSCMIMPAAFAILGPTASLSST